MVVFVKGAEQTALTTFILPYTAFSRISTFQDVFSYTTDVNVKSQRAKAFYIHVHLHFINMNVKILFSLVKTDNELS